MGKGDHLGELEQLVLWAVLRLGDAAYGVTVRQELEDRARRRLTLTATYTVLDRLESKGYLRSKLGDPTPERGGRAKRLFTLAAPGARALERHRETWTAMWRGLSPAGCSS